MVGKLKMYMYTISISIAYTCIPNFYLLIVSSIFTNYANKADVDKMKFNKYILWNQYLNCNQNLQCIIGGILPKYTFQ